MTQFLSKHCKEKQWKKVPNLSLKASVAPVLATHEVQMTLFTMFRPISEQTKHKIAIIIKNQVKFLVLQEDNGLAIITTEFLCDVIVKKMLIHCLPDIFWLQHSCGDSPIMIGGETGADELFAAVVDLSWKCPRHVLRTGTCPKILVTEWDGLLFFADFAQSCVCSVSPSQLHVLPSTCNQNTWKPSKSSKLIFGNLIWFLCWRYPYQIVLLGLQSQYWFQNKNRSVNKRFALWTQKCITMHLSPFSHLVPLWSHENSCFSFFIFHFSFFIFHWKQGS